VVVLDWMLPGPDGVEVLKTARVRGVKTPVLLLKALPAKSGDKRDAVAQQVDALVKEVDAIAQANAARELPKAAKALEAVNTRHRRAEEELPRQNREREAVKSSAVFVRSALVGCSSSLNPRVPRAHILNSPVS